MQYRNEIRNKYLLSMSIANLLSGTVLAVAFLIELKCMNNLSFIISPLRKCVFSILELQFSLDSFDRKMKSPDEVWLPSSGMRQQQLNSMAFVASH